jgi:hypothetical protein
MASSSEPSRKWGREEVSPPPPTEPEEMPPPSPAEPEKVKPPSPEEVKPPPPKEVKPPRRKVALQTVAVVRAPALNADEATWSANLFHEAFVKLRKVAVHLGLPPPSHPLQMTVKDYAFKINVLVGVVWTSLGPLCWWVPGPTTRWALGLLDLSYTTPDGVEGKDYGGGVFG